MHFQNAVVSISVSPPLSLSLFFQYFKEPSAVDRQRLQPSEWNAHDLSLHSYFDAIQTDGV